MLLSLPDLSCSAGHYTDVATLSCQPCARGSFAPVNQTEMCYPCSPSHTTTATGTTGDEADVCLPDPDGVFLIVFGSSLLDLVGK